MKQIKHEIDLVIFELFQCSEIEIEQIKFNKKERAKELEKQKKELKYKYNNYH